MNNVLIIKIMWERKLNILISLIFVKNNIVHVVIVLIIIAQAYVTFLSL